MAWYLNKYVCEHCGISWEDEWSCCCDDECPECSIDYSPTYSKNLSSYMETSSDGTYVIYYSPPEAEQIPEYEFFAEAKLRVVGRALRELARELAMPR